MFTEAGAHSQVAFQNLDFESASVPAVQPNQTVPMALTPGLPGWSGYAGTNSISGMIYNGVSVGGALITLIGPNTGFLGLSNAVIEGNYTAVLSAGVNPIGGGSYVSTGIGQTGLVPLEAQSLFFSLGSLSSVSDLQVSFDGQNLPFYLFDTGPNYTVYGATVSAFAGTSGELRFTESPISTPYSSAYLDNIYFSPTGIPEPSVFSLFGLGALLLGLLKRKVER